MSRCCSATGAWDSDASKFSSFRTGSADADRVWALAAGADAYLVKPIRVGRLLQIAARLATTRNQSRGELRASSRVKVAE